MEENTLGRVMEVLHQKKEAELVHTVLGALGKKSDEEIIEFLYTDRTAMQPFWMSHEGLASCGGWCPPTGSSRRVNIGMDVAVKLGLRPGDFIVEGDGSSMTHNDPCRSIAPGSWLAMRPNKSAHGHVCLFQADMNDGEVLWTVKKLSSDGNGDLISDGRGEEIAPPAGAVGVRPIAVCVGIVAAVKDGVE